MDETKPVLLPNKVAVYFNMLCPLMVDKVGYYMKCSLVVKE
jgi:hypothetical protein